MKATNFHKRNIRWKINNKIDMIDQAKASKSLGNLIVDKRRLNSNS
jgi:hypothetical protein